MPGFELIDEQEKNAVAEIFDESNGVLFAHGFDAMRNGRFRVREFEAAVAERFGVQHALAVSSGTAALKVALKALGVEAGDEVITQGFNFVATVEAIVDIGAIPVVLNVDATLNLDVDLIEEHITAKTKVILPVHMLGEAANMSAIMAIAKKHNLKVLEDNCEAIGAQLDGQYLGTIADAGVFSFDHGKAITSGEGGMVLTNSQDIDDYAREYHDHGHENNPAFPRGRDTKRIAGFNYRMTEMQAAVGKVQLGKLDKLLALNAERYDILHSALADKYQCRAVVKGSAGQKDCLIIDIPDADLRGRFLQVLQENGMGTKNLPDAMEWHCAYYWHHLLPENARTGLLPTQQRLEQHIAIPVAVSKPAAQYQAVAELLAALVSESA